MINMRQQSVFIQYIDSVRVFLFERASGALLLRMLRGGLAI